MNGATQGFEPSQGLNGMPGQSITNGKTHSNQNTPWLWSLTPPKMQLECWGRNFPMPPGGGMVQQRFPEGVSGHPKMRGTGGAPNHLNPTLFLGRGWVSLQSRPTDPPPIQ
eukprot:EG_transcript_30238